MKVKSSNPIPNPMKNPASALPHQVPQGPAGAKGPVTINGVSSITLQTSSIQLSEPAECAISGSHQISAEKGQPVAYNDGVFVARCDHCDVRIVLNHLPEMLHILRLDELGARVLADESPDLTESLSAFGEALQDTLDKFQATKGALRRAEIVRQLLAEKTQLH